MAFIITIPNNSPIIKPSSFIPKIVNNYPLASEIDDKYINVFTVNRDKIALRFDVKNIKEDILKPSHDLKNLMGYVLSITSEYRYLHGVSKKILKDDVFIKYITFSKEFETIPHLQQYYLIFLFNDNEAVQKELWWCNIPMKAIYLSYLKHYGVK